MDMLYAKYASPMELMQFYIEQSRFGEFVYHFIRTEQERRREEAEEEADRKLWIAYVHSMTDQSFREWKAELKERVSPSTYAMTDRQVEDTVKRSRNILNRTAL